MNLRAMLAQLREEMGEEEPQSMPDNALIERINRAGTRLLNGAPELVDGKYSWARVANQESYALPDDFGGAWFLKIDDDDRPQPVTLEEMERENVSRTDRGDSRLCSWIWNRRLGFYEASATGAITTTLASGVTASSTSLTVVTPSEALPGRGTVLIGTEKIWYEHAEASGANTVLSVLTRGAEDTLAAAHDATATVTHCGIELYYFKRYREHLLCPETGTVAITNGAYSVTAGKHYLLWTYFDAARGLESYPRDLLGLTTAEGDRLELSELNDAPYGAGYQKRIYMTKAGTTWPYFLVTTLAHGTTTYNIDVVDGELPATEFDWDTVGGGNLPDELTAALVELVLWRWARGKRRMGEAAEYRVEYERQLAEVSGLIYERRRGSSVRRRRAEVQFC